MLTRKSRSFGDNLARNCSHFARPRTYLNDPTFSHFDYSSSLIDHSCNVRYAITLKADSTACHASAWMSLQAFKQSAPLIQIYAQRRLECKRSRHESPPKRTWAKCWGAQDVSMIFLATIFFVFREEGWAANFRNLSCTCWSGCTTILALRGSREKSKLSYPWSVFLLPSQRRASTCSTSFVIASVDSQKNYSCAITRSPHKRC